MSSHIGNCSKHCNSWCTDAVQSRYFRTAANGYFAGVAFNARGHDTEKNGRMRVGLQPLLMEHFVELSFQISNGTLIINSMLHF